LKIEGVIEIEDGSWDKESVETFLTDLLEFLEGKGLTLSSALEVIDDNEDL
jgi:hypothetical protein